MPQKGGIVYRGDVFFSILKIGGNVEEITGQESITCEVDTFYPPTVSEPKAVDPQLLRPGKIDDKAMLVRLFEAGLTHDQIAAYFGVSRVAVTKMIARMNLAREGANPVLFQERIQEEILIRMENVLRYMTPEKMDKASLSQLTMTFGILFDKLRLARGQSTENVASINVHKIAEGDLDRIREIIAKHTRQKLEDVRREYVDESETVATH